MSRATHENEGSILVYGFKEKTTALMRSGIFPKVVNTTQFCQHTGISRANYNRICSTVYAGREGDRPGTTYYYISHDVLEKITRTYGIPESHFTANFGLTQFEQLIRKDPWDTLLTLKNRNTECDFIVLREHTLINSNDTRSFGPAINEKNEPELGIFALQDSIAFQFIGWENSDVILLARDPRGSVVSLLPNQDMLTSTLGIEKVLRLPETDFWQVRLDTKPGVHQFIAIFVKDNRLAKEFDTEMFAHQLTYQADYHQQRLVLTRLTSWLDKVSSQYSDNLDIVAKDLHVIEA